MTIEDCTVGVIGGTGMLGRAISHAILEQGAVAPQDFWISNRSGEIAGFEKHQNLNVTARNQALVDACELIVLCVPPAQAPRIRIDARNRLVVSVMAGVTIDEIQAMTGANRVVRAMSSPAAELHLAYSPWVASKSLNDRDRGRVNKMFEACGLTDEVFDESQIELFTALTGPVPGFVAFYAESMIDYAISKGAPPPIANRAIRQLFLAAGRMMADGAATPSEHVRQMTDYAGTTAAGLNAMKASPIAKAIAEGMDAAVEKTRRIRQADPDTQKN